MKINELRIGNYINFWGIHKGQLEHITENECYVNSYLGSVGVLYNDLRPLTVTSDILLDSGFTRTHSMYFEHDKGKHCIQVKLYPNYSYRVIIMNKGIEGIEKYTISNNCLAGIYTYFHNLQNIMSLISGYELSLTL